jgi:signal transduction histidine kinase
MLESSEKKFRKAYNRANCFKGLFTHDISNILQVTGNALEYCEIILEKNGDVDKVLEHFQLIKNQIGRGKKLIKNIMNLSEMEQTDMHIEPVNVNRNLNEAVDFLSINFPHKTIKTEIKDNGKEYYVQANELLLDVFENILINAVRYNESDEVEVVIEISEVREQEKEYIKIEFKDNGIGIQDSLKDQIFDKPFKNFTEKKGLGLGLSLVAKLLELCEGRIWVEDKIPGEYQSGSNFVILLPNSKT